MRPSGYRAMVGLLAAMVLGPLPAVAGDAAWERAILAPAIGPTVLEVDPPLIEGGRPLRFERVTLDGVTRLRWIGGLEDLRLVDQHGVEVPHLLLAPPDPDRRWIPGRVLPILATRRSSGFEIDLGVASAVDRVAIDGLAAPFVKRFTLEGSGDRRRWTLLVAEGTLFDLPERGLSRTEIDFVAGEYRYLRLTFDDRSSARLGAPASVRAREARVSQPAPSPAEIELDFEPRAAEPGTRRFALRLPARGLPLTGLVLEVPGEGDLLRPAKVLEGRFEGAEIRPVHLGGGQLRRATIDGLVASDLRIRIEPPAGRELELVVDDGDNPPLEIAAVHGELAPLPTIYFELAEGQEVRARYGDPSLPAPRYDLEVRRDALEGGVEAQRAQWGPVARSPMQAGEPGEPAVGLLGATVEPRAFDYRRPVVLAAGGLVALPLDAAVLAHARRDLRDLRLVDPSQRQVPYVLEARSEPLVLDLPLPVAEPGRGPVDGSRYLVALPVAGLPGARLVLHSDARVFERRVTLLRPAVGREPAGEVAVGEWWWVHRDPHRPAPPLVVELPAAGAPEGLVLRVDEGDNAPLVLSSAQLLLDSYRLRFFAPPEAELTLLYGGPEVQAPRYDLSLLAPRILAAPAGEATLAAEERNAAPRGPSPRLFWIALIVTTLLLLVLLARQLRGESSVG